MGGAFTLTRLLLPDMIAPSDDLGVLLSHIDRIERDDVHALRLGRLC